MRFWTKGILCLLMVACLLSFPLQAKGAASDLPDYAFDCIDGSTITPATNAGTTKLIIFTHLDASHENALIRTLLAADWVETPELSVIVVDWAAGSLADVRAWVQANGAQGSAIAFCIDESNYFRQFLNAAGLSGNTFTIPASFVVDRSGKLQAQVMGESSDIALRKLLSGHVAGIEAEKTVALSIAGENIYSEAFEILRLLNEQRAANDLPALKMDKGLLDAAMLRAAECNVYYSHTRPNGGRCFTAFPSQSGMLAENIAIGYRSAADVMDGWMNSSGHRANIMEPGFASVGIGVFLHNGIYSWVQLFSSAPATQVKAPADTLKTAKVEILQKHLIAETVPMQLMMTPNTTREISFSVNNIEYPYHNVQLSGQNVTYRSDNTKVAMVDAGGVVQAVAPGKATITATLTGTDILKTVTVEVGQHNYTESIQKPPTCAEPGIGQYVCPDCGDTKTEEIPKLTTHSWDGGTITKKPTTEKEGVMTFTCTVCAKTKTQSIPKLTAPTIPPTAAPTAPETTAPTAAPTMPATTPPTIETVAPTEPTAIPIPEPTEMPPDLLPTEPTEETTGPMESSPEFVPGTQPTQIVTQPPTEPESQPAEQSDHKLLIGIIVAAVATVAAGAFLLFWKRKK